MQGCLPAHIAPRALVPSLNRWHALQANASYFQPAAEQPAHDHGRDAVQHYLKAASKIAPADVQCITGDCCVCLSTAARRVGNPEFAVEQAELAVGAAKACKCPRLHAAAQGSLAIATFQMDRCAARGTGGRRTSTCHLCRMVGATDTRAALNSAHARARSG